jgi:plasmid stability protein
MASLVIRNLDEGLKTRLRVRAAEHGRSMEDEVRDILRSVLSRERLEPRNLAVAIRARFSLFGEVELPEVEQETIRQPPEFD